MGMGMGVGVGMGMGMGITRLLFPLRSLWASEGILVHPL